MSHFSQKQFSLNFKTIMADCAVRSLQKEDVFKADLSDASQQVQKLILHAFLIAARTIKTFILRARQPQTILQPMFFV